MAEIVEKLTNEESEKLNLFMGTCVRKNVAFALNSNKVGYAGRVGIQEVYNAPVSQIEAYGELIYKANQSNGSPFKNKSKTYYIDGKVNVNEVIENLQLIIQEKEWARQEQLLEKEIADLEKQLDGMKSEDEVKAELKDKLAKLKGVSPADKVETPAV